MILKIVVVVLFLEEISQQLLCCAKDHLENILFTLCQSSTRTGNLLVLNRNPSNLHLHLLILFTEAIVSNANVFWWLLVDQQQQKGKGVVNKHSVTERIFCFMQQPRSAIAISSSYKSLFQYKSCVTFYCYPSRVSLCRNKTHNHFFFTSGQSQ